MPLYELVLRYDDREEIRLTDRPVSIGETLQVGYEEWQVVLEREPSYVRATAAFLCELTRAQRARAEKMQVDDAERRERLRLTAPDKDEDGRRGLSPTTTERSR